MAQQTAVDWLIEELELDSNLYLIKDIVDKAKEMEIFAIVRWRNGRRKAGMVLVCQGQVEIRNAPYRFESCPDYIISY